MARYYDLPEGVLEEIMSRLPPESLIRFKRVCKSWYVLINALINDSTFVAKHLRNMTEMLSDLSETMCFSQLSATNKTELERAETDVVATHLLTMATHDFEVNHYIPCVDDFEFLIRRINEGYFRFVSHCDGIICLHARWFLHEFICL